MINNKIVKQNTRGMHEKRTQATKKLTVKEDRLANVTISSWWLLIISVTTGARQRTKAGRLAIYASILKSA